jgi:hypothetical protein
MITDSTHNAGSFDPDEPTDMEMALSFSRMLDGCRNSAGETDWAETVTSMARNVLSRMTNPFAKKLLADQISK